MSTTTSKPLKPKRGTTAQNNGYTGEAYEVTLDTDKKTLVVHDGLTAGGFPLARADEVAQKDAAQDAVIGTKISSVNGLTPDADGNVDVGGMPLGTLFPYTGKDVPAGTLRADGSTYTNMRNSFPEFYNWVVQSGLTKPLASYALTEGSCGFYGIDETTGTVRMPTLAAGVFGASVAGQYGMAVEAGLPNITAMFEFGDKWSPPNATGNGAVQALNNGWFDCTRSTHTGKGGFSFDASRSSAIYGKSDTVTPSHVKYPWVIVVYNAAVPPSVAQAGEFVELLAGKEDKGAVRSVNGVGADAAGNVSDVAASGNEYIRFTNGLQMCFGYITIAQGSTSTTKNFAAAFKKTPLVALSVWGNGGAFTYMTGLTTSALTIKLTAGAGPISSQYIAIGYWK